MSVLEIDDNSLTIDFEQFLQCSTPSTPPAFVSSKNNSQRSGQGSQLAHAPSSQDLDDSSYDLQDLLEEAYQQYGTKKPPFCIVDKGEKQRAVRLMGNGIEGALTFQPWPGGSWGYWLFTDQIGDKYICKFDKGYYHVWQGLSSGFDSQPMAKAVSTVIKRDRSSDNDDNNQSPKRKFRHRKVEQQQPYAISRIRFQNQRKGINLTESELEESLLADKVHRRSSLRKRELPSKSNSSDTADSDMGSPEAAHSLAIDHDSLKMVPHAAVTSDSPGALLRSRLDDFSGPSIPIYLLSAESLQNLFDNLHLRWAFRLDGKSIRYCIAKFPWLDDDRSIFLHADNADAYHLTWQEIKCAPGRLNGQISIDLEVHVE